MNGAAGRYLGSLLERATGQRIQPGRGWLPEAALGPVLREHGLDSLDALVAAIVDGRAPALQQATIDALLNHETSFFRDAAAFAAIETTLLPGLAAARARARRLRLWCAGCSTGQEAYSLAMILTGPAWAGWTVEIVASDVSPSSIRRAEAGVYNGFEIQRGLPVTRMIRWFRPDRDDWRAGPEISRPIRFVVHNLLDPRPPLPGPYDLVLCRNLLLYLADDRRRTAFDRLAKAMAPDGYLVLGAGETVGGRTDAFVVDDAMRAVFRRAPAGGRRAA